MNRALAVLVLVVAAYAGVVTWMLRHEQCRARDEARVAQEAALASAGAVVAKPVTSAELKEAARPVEKQIERVVAACPAARPVEVVSWRTDPVPVPCPPAPSPPTDATAPAKPADVEIEVRGTEARLETKDGAVAAVGEVEVWRAAPPPEEMLGRRPWRADLSRLLRVEPGIPVKTVGSKWMVGPAVGFGRRGALYGAMAAFPPLRLGRIESRLWAGALASHGQPIVIFGMMVDW